MSVVNYKKETYHEPNGFCQVEYILPDLKILYLKFYLILYFLLLFDFTFVVSNKGVRLPKEKLINKNSTHLFVGKLRKIPNV